MPTPPLRQLFGEAETLISRFFDPISTFHLHIYYTALPSLSKDTILHQTYATELSDTRMKLLDKLQRVKEAIRGQGQDSLLCGPGSPQREPHKEKKKRKRKRET
jgi:hypothetical protein